MPRIFLVGPTLRPLFTSAASQSVNPLPGHAGGIVFYTTHGLPIVTSISQPEAQKQGRCWVLNDSGLGRCADSIFPAASALCMASNNVLGVVGRPGKSRFASGPSKGSLATQSKTNAGKTGGKAGPQLDPSKNAVTAALAAHVAAGDVSSSVTKQAMQLVNKDPWQNGESCNLHAIGTPDLHALLLKHPACLLINTVA